MAGYDAFMTGSIFAAASAQIKVESLQLLPGCLPSHSRLTSSQEANWLAWGGLISHASMLALPRL